MRFHGSLSVFLLGLASVAVGNGCGSRSSGPKDDEADDVATCDKDLQCDDGVYCNGLEICRPQDRQANELGCVSVEEPCSEGARCDESKQRCVSSCAEEPDADGDGHDATDCGGDDCDDEDVNRYPGNMEVCDSEHRDEDCDPKSVGDLDSDKDGYASSACCNTDDEGTKTCGNDCDDEVAGSHPTEAEQCDGIDNDCDGQTDEGFECVRGSDPVSCTRANGDPGERICDGSCSLSACRAEEVCNGADENDNGSIDETFLCAQNQENVDCTTACGTPGLGTCSSTCDAVELCLAAYETCNYCDDTGASGFLDESSLLVQNGQGNLDANKYIQYLNPGDADDGYTCSDGTFAGAGRCEFEEFYDGDTVVDFYAQLLDGTANFQQGSLWVLVGDTMGWGKLEIELEMQVRGPDLSKEPWGPPPEFRGGWGVALTTGSPRPGNIDYAGLPTDGEGVSFEWSWASPWISDNGEPTPMTEHGDRYRIRTGSGSPTESYSADYYYRFGGVSPDGGGYEWVTQELYITYTPDDPITPIDEEVFAAYLGKGGVLIADTSSRNDEAFDWIDLEDAKNVGDELSIAITASANGRPYEARMKTGTLKVDGIYGTTTFEYGGSVKRTRLCASQLLTP